MGSHIAGDRELNLNDSGLNTNITIPKWGKWAAAGVVAAYLGVTSFYTISPSEEGVITRFGHYTETTGSGLHFKLPWPIESVDKVNVTEVRRLEVGFTTLEQGPPAKYKDVLEESLMLTGDENIVDASVIVQYRIKDSKKYLFNVSDPEITIRDVTEAAFRQGIGNHSIDEALTTGKIKIQDETYSKLQSILDIYDSGIQITAVKLQDVNPPSQAEQAFKDVASAREEKVKIINEAQGYKNKIIPEARGGAQKLIQEAEGYKAKRINEAVGDTTRFLEVLTEYEKAPTITEDRLYIETLRRVYPNLEVIILGNDAVPLQFLDIGKQLQKTEENKK